MSSFGPNRKAALKAPSRNYTVEEILRISAKHSDNSEGMSTAPEDSDDDKQVVLANKKKTYTKRKAWEGNISRDQGDPQRIPSSTRQASGSFEFRGGDYYRMNTSKNSAQMMGNVSSSPLRDSSQQTKILPRTYDSNIAENSAQVMGDLTGPDALTTMMRAMDAIPRAQHGH